MASNRFDSPAGRRRRWPVVLGVSSAGLLLCLLLSHRIWLTWFGQSLIYSDPPVKVDLIVVLGGDASGRRLLKAAELCMQGYAKHVLVSGPYYGTISESEGSIPDALEKGYPWELFVSYPNHSTSTIEEAFALSGEFQRLGTQRIMIVTSSFHSRRTSVVYRCFLPDFQFHFIAVPEVTFSPDSWWKSSVARKLFFSEWLKTAGTLLVRFQRGSA